jgi:hypothetical protein
MKYIVIAFDKPLYIHDGRQKIFLNEDYINKAKRLGKRMKIVVADVGTGLYTWREWMRNAEYMEKVYKYPDRPMKLWGHYFEKGHGLEANRETKRMIEDVSIPKDIRLRLKEVWKQKYDHAGANI